ncbi:MAG TPA: RNA polymerase sigma factor [Sandaracinaceae bacterium LLY-WYZ-13_1]|nr:RNA polymerase sigma factor [Sandaracinaceae bacterium LLY-WYZ-13_1]
MARADERLTALDGGLEEDHARLREAAAGDEAAVRALYRAHVDVVFRCVARILGPHDPDLEDVVQQAFLAALDGADRFDGRSKVATWLVGIATRRALDAARARHRRARWGRITEWVGLGRPASRPDARHDALSQAEAALATLEPSQRTVFVLHQVEGYTFKEIAEMTGTGISTLHARLKAARRRLDAALAEGAEGATR